VSKFVNGQAAKAIVALIGTVSTLLSHYASSWWEPTVVAGLTLLGVYLVPNQAPAAKAQGKAGDVPQGMLGTQR
jgi:hypothetical protein